MTKFYKSGFFVRTLGVKSTPNAPRQLRAEKKHKIPTQSYEQRNNIAKAGALQLTLFVRITSNNILLRKKL